MSNTTNVRLHVTYHIPLTTLPQPNTFGKYDFPPNLFLVLIISSPSAVAIYHPIQLARTFRSITTLHPGSGGARCADIQDCRLSPQRAIGFSWHIANGLVATASASRYCVSVISCSSQSPPPALDHILTVPWKPYQSTMQYQK